MKSKLCQFFHIMFLLWSHAAAQDAEVLCDHLEDCLLPCHFDPGPAPIINWLKKPHSLIVFSISDGRLQNMDEEYRGRASLSEEQLRRGNASLLLREVKVQDEGEYECLTSTLSSDLMESTLRLRVRAPVRQVSVHQQGQQLVCRSEEIYPKPGVHWSISTETIPRVTRSEQGLFSVISSVSVSDSVNQYICNISTPYDWRSATYRNNPQMSFSDAPVTVSCSEPSAPVKSLSWRFNHSETILTRTGSELVYFTSWRQFVDGLTESNSLVLKDLTQDQQGLFTCELSTETEQFIINTLIIKAQSPVAPGNMLPLWIGLGVGLGSLLVVIWAVGLLYCQKSKVQLDRKIKFMEEQSSVLWERERMKNEKFLNLLLRPPPLDAQSQDDGATGNGASCDPKPEDQLLKPNEKATKEH